LAVARVRVGSSEIDLATAHEAADAAAREARRTMREKRKAELRVDVDESVGKLKEKLHVS
jgi:hypothetical protein